MTVTGNSAKAKARIQAALAVLEPNQACLLAYSGGLDSSVLLHATHSLRPDISLRAAYVDHGLQPSATNWQQHCEQQCASLNVPYLGLRLQDPPKSNIEAWAREQRYAQLQSVLLDGEVLLTAHHLRDQAETLLMNLLRGSGLAGLAAMPAQRPLGSHRLLRPLLEIHPDDVQAYAGHFDLAFIDDPSNADRRFDRNFIRHEVLAPLELRFPQALSNMARSSSLLAESLLDVDVSFDHVKRLPVQVFANSDTAQNNRRLLQWFRNLGLPMPRHRMLNEIWQQMLASSEDSNPVVTWPGAELRRYREHLYAMPSLQGQEHFEWREISCNGEREWPCGGRIIWELPQGRWRIANAQGGEQIVLRGHHRRLKKLFQQAAVPPWQRQRIPLLWRDDECLAVGGLWRSDLAPDFVFDWDALKDIENPA